MIWVLILLSKYYKLICIFLFHHGFTLSLTYEVVQRQYTCIDVHLHSGASMLGRLGVATLADIWQGGRGRVVKFISYNVQEVCSKVVTFEKKKNNLPRSSCKWPIFAWKVKFF